MKKYPTEKPIISDNVLLPPSFKMEFITDSNVQPGKQICLPGEFDLTIKQNTRITAADHFQDVRHVELYSEDPAFK